MLNYGQNICVLNFSFCSSGVTLVFNDSQKYFDEIIEFVIELLDLVEGCGPPWAGAIPGCFNPPGPLHLPFPDLLGAMEFSWSNLLVGVCLQPLTANC